MFLSTLVATAVVDVVPSGVAIRLREIFSDVCHINIDTRNGTEPFKDTRSGYVACCINHGSTVVVQIAKDDEFVKFAFQNLRSENERQWLVLLVGCIDLGQAGRRSDACQRRGFEFH